MCEFVNIFFCRQLVFFPTKFIGTMLEYAPVPCIVRRGFTKTRLCDCKIFVLFHENKNLVNVQNC